MNYHFNQKLVEIFIDFFESKGYKDFLNILPQKGRMNFLHDYYRYNIISNKRFALEYHNMYCNLSTINN